ncbi:MAG: hypothetical protein WA324_19555 [Bryobacteraceae bacterium]
MSKPKLLFSAVALLAFAGVMSAQDLFTWGYAASNGDSASGTLTATETNPAEFQWTVDSFSGTWIPGDSTPAGITGLATGYGSTNDFFYGFNGSASSLGSGITFTTTANSNVIGFNNGGEEIFNSGGSQIGGSGYNTSDISPNGYQFMEIGPVTPSPWEPSDAVFLSGALVFGWMQYRRMRRKSAA